MTQFRHASTDPSLPVWLRLGFYALDHAYEPLTPDQLRYELTRGQPLTDQQVSDGITDAIAHGLLREDATHLLLTIPSGANA